MESKAMNTIHELTLKILTYTSNVTHVVISLALVAATVLIATLFFYEIYLAIKVHTLIQGFLRALGILLLLWTMVELIATEMKFLKGGEIDIAIFVEVALVVVVREIIMLPVTVEEPGWIDLGKWVGAAALLGLTYFLVRMGKKYQWSSEQTSHSSE
ncbi:phosphate-starvation-inducible PsiE family protein [Kaarinaea lacus]